MVPAQKDRFCFWKIISLLIFHQYVKISLRPQLYPASTQLQTSHKEVFYGSYQTDRCPDRHRRLYFKLDTLAVVVVAGLATGLVAGMSPMKILETLGTAFITNRTATLFILTLPVIGICERNGLKDKAVDFITSLKNATTGRLIAIWQIIRTLASAFSLRIGGHPQFIRPLINPMAQAAAVVQYGKLDEKTEDDIKGMCAGSENYGNFFAQNCFMGSSGTLLIVSTLTEQGYPVDALQIAGQSVPIAVFAVIVGVIYALIFDQILKRRFSDRKKQEEM